MALFALTHEDDLPVYSCDAELGHTYICCCCGGRVRVKKGYRKIPYFYHLSKSPSCRLYSKSEDHLVAQLALKQLLPPGETTMEKPFRDILRVSDLIWEKPKIAFEIQCSLISELDAEKRIHEYGQAGYQVVWLLDDRVFNKKKLKRSEAFLRKQPCYYVSIRKRAFPEFYDQFEVFAKNERIHRGQRLKVKLQEPRIFPIAEWSPEHFPRQVIERAATTRHYFYGDLLDKAVLAKSTPSFAFSMQSLRALERLLIKRAMKKPSIFKKLFTKWVLEPFGLLMLTLYERAEKS